MHDHLFPTPEERAVALAARLGITLAPNDPRLGQLADDVRATQAEQRSRDVTQIRAALADMHIDAHPDLQPAIRQAVERIHVALMDIEFPGWREQLVQEVADDNA